jgi:hypothetical protein
MTMLRTNFNRAVLTAATLLLSGALVAVGQPPAQAAITPVEVTVNARAGLAIMPTTGLGVNHAIWDASLATPETTDLLRAAGVRMVRYPGGSYGDIYHWETHTAPGGFVAPNTDFDTFVAGARRTGAEPMVIANYGTGTPQEAAAWVRDANITKGYDVRYWSIGNENYGNGHYGADWEADDHADKSPTGYANLVVAYAEAMKAVDPTIQVGAVLTMPANWPDGLIAEGDTDTWNDTVLSIAGPHIDYVDVHWYPAGDITPAEVLTAPAKLPDAVYLLRDKIARLAGPDASRIGIALTEFNVQVGKNTQPGALFLAESYASLLAQGVFTVQWWNVHNGIEEVSVVAGQTDYGDGGLLSSGNCLADGVTCEPPLNTPFAPYHSLSLVNTFVRAGDQFVRAATDQPLVSAHAARRADGDIAVLLANFDPDNSAEVSIDYAGFAPAAGAPVVHSYTNGASAVSTGQTGSATSQTLPPYSLTALVVKPSGAIAGRPGAPGQPTASAVTDRAATISWPAADPGSHPIAKYEVYRQHGAVSEQLGETSGTSLEVGNLRPGTRYTVNVLTRDTAGNVSWSSPPLTFMTGTPATSTCAVRFTDAGNWGSGYVASVDIINTGPSPIDGWTLDFSWPTPWQRMDGGWNGTWSQTGTEVKVTSVDFNRTLAAGGGSANVGFVAGYDGANILPVAFRLNGTLCAAG